MTTLIKCPFCLRNGSDYVTVPDGTPVRCQYCKRVQPETNNEIRTERKREASEPSVVLPDNIFS